MRSQLSWPLGLDHWLPVATLEASPVPAACPIGPAPRCWPTRLIWTATGCLMSRNSGSALHPALSGNRREIPESLCHPLPGSPVLDAGSSPRSRGHTSCTQRPSARSRASWPAVRTAPHRAQTWPGARASLSSGSRYASSRSSRSCSCISRSGASSRSCGRTPSDCCLRPSDRCLMRSSSPYSGVKLIVLPRYVAIAGRSLASQSDTAPATCSGCVARSACLSAPPRARAYDTMNEVARQTLKSVL